jgi:hypothetical protein
MRWELHFKKCYTYAKYTGIGNDIEYGLFKFNKKYWNRSKV